ncbi:MAG: SidA/IucD/PvdA family monooxygenase [Proteobacteria bacterium]|nr:SidA/IucD/PvdA family monooxygenase [Pseudomonadota bacterium]
MPLNTSASLCRFESTSEVEVDCVGIGFGPANIAIAVALDEMGYAGTALFLERNAAPDWQPEMLLEGADIQHNPLRDFVTPRNPTSEYGFLSYLKSEGRLWDFFNLGEAFPPRTEYARYVRWVARHFDHQVAYGECVERVEAVTERTGPARIRITTARGKKVLARALLFAPGRSPHVPEPFAPYCGDRVTHFTGYLTATARWTHERRMNRIAVIGASQSAVEIVLDLTSRFPAAQVHNIFRNFGYQLKDTSPFTEHIYFPEFVDYYHAADTSGQAQMTRDLWRSNYGSADGDVIRQLYLKRYGQLVSGQQRICMHGNRDIASVEQNAAGEIEIELVDRYDGKRQCVAVDAVVLATGFRNFGNQTGQELCHPLLRGVQGLMRTRDDGTLFVTRDYRLESADAARPVPPIYLNGVCESTHGFGDAGSFSLLSIRSWAIAMAMVGALDESMHAQAARSGTAKNAFLEAMEAIR